MAEDRLYVIAARVLIWITVMIQQRVELGLEDRQHIFRVTEPGVERGTCRNDALVGHPAQIQADWFLMRLPSSMIWCEVTV